MPAWCLFESSLLRLDDELVLRDNAKLFGLGGGVGWDVVSVSGGWYLTAYTVLAALAVSVRLMGVTAGAGRAGHNGGCKNRVLLWFEDCAFERSFGLSVFLGLD